MPQAWLPLIPSGSTAINDVWSVVKESSRWTYFCGVNPVFFHSEGDRRSFGMFTAQLICQDMCKQAEVVRCFGVSINSVYRSVKKYKQGGADAFFKPRKGQGGSVITDEIKARAQQMLNLGKDKKEVAAELDIRYDTFCKVINQSRLSEPTKSKATVTSTKSTRSIEDASSEIGNACTRPLERICVGLGLLPGGAPTRFESCYDVFSGGVMCALPTLVANGLLSHVDECFKSLGGYYTTLQVLILVAQMALCRIKTVEQLQYYPPGELGKLRGLDRVPEVRCLRNKLSELSEDDAPQK